MGWRVSSLSWLMLLTFMQSALCQSCSGVTRTSTQCSVEGLVCIIPTTIVSARNTGRVQVCKNRQWGTFASLSVWSEKNAQVACREAGFSGAINSIYPTTVSIADRASSSMPVHYTNVSCRGSESSLLNCTLSNDHSNVIFQSNNHAFDVFVVCRPTSSSGRYSDVHVVNTDYPNGEKVGDLRLYGDTRNGHGAVEIFTSQFAWSSICPDGFSSADAAVICTQFGYSTGISVNYDTSSVPNSVRLLYNAVCTTTGPGTSSTSPQIINAGKCSFTVTSGGCPSGTTLYAGVQCSSTSSLVDGDIRLFGSTSSESGIVEVFYNNKWGMICEQGIFALNEARAVCDQLGLNRDDASIMSATSLLDEESSMKAIWLTNIDCSSSDTTFIGCARGSQPQGYGFCRIYDLAAVRCGSTSSGGLSSGAISGIVFAIIFLVFFVIPFGYFFGKSYWVKRHQYSWYNTLTTPSEWCDCDCDCDCCPSPAPRRTFALGSERNQTTENTETVTIENVEPTAAEPLSFGGFTERRSSNSNSPAEAAPITEEPQESTFTKLPPPSYNTSDNFPSVSPKPQGQDLPPPYPGPGPAVGFAFPPPTLSEPSAPPLASGYPQHDPAYPPPPPQGSAAAQYDPAYPPPVAPPQGPAAAQYDLAYPPPVAPPQDLIPQQEVPYPVNLEYGGGAYPPPTVHGDPNTPS